MRQFNKQLLQGRVGFGVMSNELNDLDEYWMTVVVPTFNRCEALGQTLEDLCEVATQLDLQVVVVDDGSTDNTASLLDSIQARFNFLKRIDIAKNSGFANALVQGLRSADGKWVILNADDDLLIADGIRKLREFLEKNDQLVFISPQWLKDGLIGRGVRENRVVRPWEYRASANHGPALVYRRDQLNSTLLLLEDLLCRKEEMAILYPQVILAVPAILHRRAHWFNVPVGREGWSLPSGIVDSSGSRYWAENSRLEQSLSLRRVLGELYPLCPSLLSRRRLHSMIVSSDLSVLAAVRVVSRSEDLIPRRLPFLLANVVLFDLCVFLASCLNRCIWLLSFAKLGVTGSRKR